MDDHKMRSVLIVFIVVAVVAIVAWQKTYTPAKTVPGARTN